MDSRALWFAVLLCAPLSGASPVFGGESGPPELLWFKRLGERQCDAATSVKEVNGDGFIVVGLTQSAGGSGREDYLLRISPSGELLWRTPFAEGRGDRQFAVEVIDEGFVVAGRAGPCEDVRSCAHFSKVSHDGTVLWEKGVANRLFAATEDRTGGAVEITTAPDGGFVYIGETELGGVTKVFAGKVDSEGDREWESLVDEGVAVEACCIERTREGGYIVGGISAATFVLTRLAGNGRVVWQRSYAGPSRGFSLQEVVGGFTFSGSTNGIGFAFRTDSDGDVLSQVERPNTDGAFHSRRLADGGYVVATNVGTDALLFKMDERPEVAWEKVIDENDGTLVASFEVTRDGGYVVAGVTYTSSRDLFVARLSPTGSGRFIRGDSNDDGHVNLADAVFSLSRLFGGRGEGADCLQAADSDDDGEVTLTDSVFLLQYLFRSGPRPPAPFESCGIDMTVDALGCAGAKSCGV